jgi:hypothetical protein
MQPVTRDCQSLLGLSMVSRFQGIAVVSKRLGAVLPSIHSVWVRQPSRGRCRDPALEAARARVRFLVTSGFLESYRGALALGIGSWFPAGPAFGLALTQGLRPGLIYVAPAGLDWGGVSTLVEAEGVPFDQLRCRVLLAWTAGGLSPRD